MYGHINVDKLEHESRAKATEKHNLQRIKEKMEGLNSYQDQIKTILKRTESKV
jgi:hypothetical protein